MTYAKRDYALSLCLGPLLSHSPEIQAKPLGRTDGDGAAR